MAVTMNTLVDQITTDTDLTPRDVRVVLRAFVATVQTELSNPGGKVTVTGLGTFKSVEKGNRMARNPRTGEQTFVDPYLKPDFKASKTCKDTVNGRR